MKKADKYNELLKHGNYDEADALLAIAWKDVDKYLKNGLNIIDAMEKAGFEKENKLQNTLDDIIEKEKRKNPYFPNGKPFEDLIKGDERLDELLMVDGYKINGHIHAYYNDLQKYKVGDLLDKIGIGLNGLFVILNGMCDFLRENTKKPIRIQNKIKECLDDLNEHPGCGQVMQILFLQGIIEWFKHCYIDEKSKDYDEAQTLCNWVYERLIEVCAYYFIVFNKNSDSEPLDNYLASTDVYRIYVEHLNVNEKKTIDDESNSNNTKEKQKLSFESYLLNCNVNDVCSKLESLFLDAKGKKAATILLALNQKKYIIIPERGKQSIYEAINKRFNLNLANSHYQPYISFIKGELTTTKISNGDIEQMKSYIP